MYPLLATMLAFVQLPCLYSSLFHTFIALLLSLTRLFSPLKPPQPTRKHIPHGLIRLVRCEMCPPHLPRITRPPASKVIRALAERDQIMHHAGTRLRILLHLVKQLVLVECFLVSDWWEILHALEEAEAAGGGAEGTHALEPGAVAGGPVVYVHG